MPKDKDYEIIVNGTAHILDEADVTFSDLVELAFPGHPSDPNIVYTVTFDNALRPHDGILEEGGSVQVKKKHTVFDVTQTNRS